MAATGQRSGGAAGGPEFNCCRAGKCIADTSGPCDNSPNSVGLGQDGFSSLDLPCGRRRGCCPCVVQTPDRVIASASLIRLHHSRTADPKRLSALNVTRIVDLSAFLEEIAGEKHAKMSSHVRQDDTVVTRKINPHQKQHTFLFLRPYNCQYLMSDRFSTSANKLSTSLGKLSTVHIASYVCAPTALGPVIFWYASRTIWPDVDAYCGHP